MSVKVLLAELKIPGMHSKQDQTIDSASFAATMTQGWIVTTKGTECCSPRAGRRASATTSRARHRR